MMMAPYPSDTKTMSGNKAPRKSSRERLNDLLDSLLVDNHHLDLAATGGGTSNSNNGNDEEDANNGNGNGNANATWPDQTPSATTTTPSPAHQRRRPSVSSYARKISAILLAGDAPANATHVPPQASESIRTSGVGEIKRAFDAWETARTQGDERREFGAIEGFVEAEQRRGAERRKKARVVQAGEEVLMAAEIAKLKDFRLRSEGDDQETALQNKISDIERAYLHRKMVVSKAAQLANSDCRMQFSAVRSFFETLHHSRKTSLRQSYDRSRKIMALQHRLCETDARVMALEQQSAERMFRKKEANLNELHMAQNLEEAAYLESMFDLLDKVQVTKEDAATELFHLQVQNLKECKEAQSKRDAQLNDLRADATLQMANLVAYYVGEQAQNNEDDQANDDKVATAERKKDFRTDPANPITSVSELYDTIIWSVATSRLGLSTTGSSIYTDSVYDGDESDDDEEGAGGIDAGDGELRAFNDGKNDQDLAGIEDSKDWYQQDGDYGKRQNDDGSLVSGSTANTTETGEEDLSVVGKMHIKQLKKDLRANEKSLMRKHKAEMKRARRLYKKKSRELRSKHQQNVDTLLRRCVDERHRLRDGIVQRMNRLKENQALSTKTIQESIEQDVRAMQEAWMEHKRLEDAEKMSFDKAQALISAQVFHEVRNALSSVIAMSEMMSSLQEDPAVTKDGLVDSVNEMMDQNEEVVRYSLSMLNNILDINKIKTGSYQIQKNSFDLADLMRRATTMQLVKAQSRGVKMSFENPLESCIAFTDKDIVQRIVTNFISNAVKFTSSGAIQPFILPVDKLMPSVMDPKRGAEFNDDSSQEDRFKLVAVGVADTGCGLSQEMLNKAEAGLYNSDTKGLNSGAKNSGFGLHLAHQLAETLDTRIYLADLASCHTVLNNDISNAIKQYQSNIFISMNRSSTACGTVLFVVIPVFVDARQDRNRHMSFDSGSTLSAMSLNSGDDTTMPDLPLYKFCPQTTNKSTNDCLRILVADDVLMLRKGLVRSILQVFEQFENCRVSIHTACTAEDELRLLASRPFDIVISDNQFCPPENLKGVGTNVARPHILHDGDSKMQNHVSDFFRSESFTLEDGDGDLSGLQALLQLMGCSDQLHPHPTPILILLSGHKFDLPPTCGVIVVQKPLKTSEIVPLLENHAKQLIESGLCFEEKDQDSGIYRVVNQRGTQIFSRKL